MSAPTDRGTTGAAPAAERSIDELDVEICRLARQMNAETYRMLLLVRDFDDRFGWAKWGLRNCAEWLAWRCGLSFSAAREKARTAQALRSLPAISAAFAEGRLSYSKVRALTRVAYVSDEDSLLAYALDATAAQVEERCRQIRNVEPESTDGARRVWERRSLTMFRDRSRGVVRITVELPEADGELVGRALESAVAAGDVALGIEFASNPERSADSWRAQQADALVALAKAYFGGGPGVGVVDASATSGGGADPSGDALGARVSSATRSASTADHCQVVMHVDEKSLRGGAGRSDLAVETMKRLTCDGSLITIVEDERGTPLDVGRKQRTVSTPLKRALWSRDRGCSFPGCQRTRYVDAHHIRHWANGGDTSLENLTLLCTHHHTLLHEGGFTIHRDANGDIYFRRPDGRVIPRAGYRAADMLDDVAVALPGENPSAEVRMAAIVHSFQLDDESSVRLSTEGSIAANVSENPSAEGFGARVVPDSPCAGVREASGRYRVGSRSSFACGASPRTPLA
jgi:Domain of unknown function (DUF222)/HNH endonuclease